MEKNCKYCGEPLEIDAHKNREYCDNEFCYYRARSERNSGDYKTKKQYLNEFKRIESILRNAFTQFGEYWPIQVSFFNDRFMNWTLFSNQIIIDNYLTNVVGNYAYCLFTNKTVALWKISKCQE